MKKFVFTNEKYQGIKEMEFDRLKLDMRNVDKEIDMANAALAELDIRFTAERKAFAAACKEGVGAGELINYQGFFEYLKDKRRELEQILSALLSRKRELTQKLLRVQNELRVLDEMRQEQYQAYCKEVAEEEAKELDANMAFTIFERAV